MCSPGYYHNGFVATLTSVRFEQSVCRGSLMTTYMYIYISGNKRFTTQRVLKFQRSKMSIILYMKIYEIIKAMCPPGYHHNSFVATHALGDMIYGYKLLVPMNQIILFEHSFGLLVSAMCKRTSFAQVPELPQSHCSDNWEKTLSS